MDTDFVVESSPDPSNGSEFFEALNLMDEVSVSNSAAVFVGTYSHILKGTYRSQYVSHSD
jgi:hypothetical protein